MLQTITYRYSNKMDSFTTFKRIYKRNRLDPDLEYLFKKLINEKPGGLDYYFLHTDWYWLDRFISSEIIDSREIITDCIYDITDGTDNESLLNFAIHYWKEDGCPYIDDVWDSVNTIQILNIFIKNRICPYHSSTRRDFTDALEMFYNMDDKSRLCDKTFLTALLEYMAKWKEINGKFEYFERNVTRDEYIQLLFLKYNDRSIIERVFAQNSGEKNLIFVFLDIGVNINQVIEIINITMNNREIDWRFDFKIIFHYGLILNKIHIDENTDKYFYKRYNGLYKCWYRWRFLAHKKRFNETLVALQWHPKSQRVAEIANHFTSLKSI